MVVKRPLPGGKCMGVKRQKLDEPNLCPVCNGEGVTARGKFCKTCKGKGILIPKPPKVAKKK